MSVAIGRETGIMTEETMDSETEKSYATEFLDEESLKEGFDGIMDTEVAGLLEDGARLVEASHHHWREVTKKADKERAVIGDTAGMNKDKNGRNGGTSKKRVSSKESPQGIKNFAEKVSSE